MIDWDNLKKAARSARQNAYAPYSNFTVGAAVLADGLVFSGCNVENSSYPVGLCAERAALAAAVAAGYRKIEAIVIAAENPIPPCGMCRQALAEFNSTMPIIMLGEQAEKVSSLGELFPSPFDKSELTK